MIEVPNSRTEVQISEMLALLDEKKPKVEQGLQDAGAEAQPVSLGEPIVRLTCMDAVQQQHMAAARKQRLEAIGQQIASTPGRGRRGEYGECMRCEEPVGYERLKARPEALLCLSCQEATGR
jgi:DnaK suppressor protein